MLARAPTNRILPPSQWPEGSLTDEMERIREAAQHFHASPGVALRQVLWTRSGPYWNGEIAAELARQPACEQPTGFVLLFARDFSRRAVLLGHAQPFVVDKEIVGNREAGGPYLVLIACELDPTGRAVASIGYAQPVLSGHHFMPVASPFERDVLTALVALQRKLDCQGIDCTITRPFEEAEERFSDRLDLAFCRDGEELRRLTVELSHKDGRRKKGDAPDGCFHLGPGRFADGSFIDWIEQSLEAPPASLPA
ncbi:hypothetical protein M527_03035 [Sphingobium indicum IP26]|uniref:Uncharacterized protein n=1 Tax=Sphingobium indicum F2 TaxID=1450518 RepID=A0A8E1C4D3_9SPHN|nr:hypothetical protein [Sphingobium indicum]EPR11061.1 hypothetical protein M527_03035 [Sphingobium indicum IP26]KER38199.1 hypothetical protein AL00_02400 [Sphingobium indicum F2]